MLATALPSVSSKRRRPIGRWVILCMHSRSETRLMVSRRTDVGGKLDSKHPTGWPGGSRRPANWTIQSYVDQWNQYVTVISQKLTGVDAIRLFQGCAFEAPRHLGNRTYWNVQNAELDGMGPDKAITVSDHEVGLISTNLESAADRPASTWGPTATTRELALLLRQPCLTARTCCHVSGTMTTWATRRLTRASSTLSARPTPSRARGHSTSRMLWPPPSGPLTTLCTCRRSRCRACTFIWVPATATRPGSPSSTTTRPLTSSPCTTAIYSTRRSSPVAVSRPRFWSTRQTSAPMPSTSRAPLNP